MRFYLVVNLDKANAADCAAEAAAELLHCGAEVLLTPELNTVLNCSGCQVLDEREAMQSCDAAISIGGDGTMIHTALDALEFDRPVIGINSGRLGYLTQIEPPFGDSLQKLAAGQFGIQPRTVLSVTVRQPDGSTCQSYALNDVVIARQMVASMIDIEVFRGGAAFASYRADGLIFATPTGSTAYSMSAGGAIVDPGMDCLIVTPICPHSLADRSVVLGPDAPLEVRLVTRNTPPDAGVAVDGTTICPMVDGTRLEISAAARKSRFIQLSASSFYQTLGKKLTGTEPAEIERKA